MPEIKGSDTTRWVAVVGSRQFDGAMVSHRMRELVEANVRRLTPGWGIVSGGASGVDTWAVDEAVRRGIPVKEIKPDYERHGQGATFIRNQQIVDAAECVVAYWDGASHGTAFTITKAWHAKKLLRVIYADGRTIDGNLGRCVAMILAQIAIGKPEIGYLAVAYPDDMISEAERIARNILTYGKDPSDVGG